MPSLFIFSLFISFFHLFSFPLSFLFFSFVVFPVDAIFALLCLSPASVNYLCILPLPCSRALLFPGVQLLNVSDILVFMFGDSLFVACIQKTPHDCLTLEAGGEGLMLLCPTGL